MKKALFVFLEAEKEKSNIQELLGTGIPVEDKHVCLTAGLNQLKEKLREQHPLFIFIKKTEKRGVSKRDDPYTCVLDDIAAFNKAKRIKSKIFVYSDEQEPEAPIAGIEHIPLDRIPLLLGSNLN